MAFDTMHEYYREQTVLPTHGRFVTEADLAAHERHRREVFTEKLGLPPRLFRGLRMIEFGPDAGENSLVFARWGADCTLVEPNPKSLPVITDYFQHYELSDRLTALERDDIAGFARRPDPAQKFDLIDAEGFLFTVKPESLWIDLFRRLVADDGFVVLFNCEPYGSFLESFTKMIHHRLRERTGAPPLETARLFFQSKWDSIPHKRSLESFVMDVLENPFVRLRYFLEPQALCRQMHAAGFSLYSSWPPYKDGLDVRWFKKALSPAEQLRSQDAFIARSRLGHLFGRPHFLPHPDPELDRRLGELIAFTDALIDQPDPARVARCREHLVWLARVVESSTLIATEADAAETARAIRSLQQILDLLTSGTVEALVRFCNEDPGFIRTWGGPSHFAVFRKEHST